MISVKKISFFIIFLVMLMFFAAFFTSLSTDNSISTISYKHNNDYLLEPARGKINGGDKIVGEFRARENYLGTIALPLQSFKWRAPDEEKIFTFKIKEKKANNWININKYKTNIFARGIVFPFGFAIIKNSKGKIYYFEITAEKGEHLSPLYLGSDESYLVSKYQFPKKEIINSPGNILTFLTKKINYSFNYKEFIPIFVIYVSIFTLFLLSVIFSVMMKKIVLSIFLFPIFIYLLFLPIKNDIVFISIVIFWIVLILKEKLSSIYSFIYAIFFLSLTLLLLVFDRNFAAEKSAEFAYMFIFIAVVYEIFSLIKSKNYFR